MVIEQKIKKCFICDSEEQVEEHHIDWNHENDAEENRIFLCKKHHVNCHRIGHISLDEFKDMREEVKDMKQKGDYEEFLDISHTFRPRN